MAKCKMDMLFPKLIQRIYIQIQTVIMFRQQTNKMSYVGSSDNKMDFPEGSFKKPIQLPATLFNKSPYKDRENRPNAGNTPLKKISSKPTLQCQPSNSRLVVSPLKHTRQNSNLSEPNPTSSSKLLPKKRSANQDSASPSASFCRNHTNKQAKFVIEIQTESLPYCEKCAILLASQGFKVERLPGDNVANSAVGASMAIPDKEEGELGQRRREIDQFLDHLGDVVGILQKKKAEVQTVLRKSEGHYAAELGTVENYYNRIGELLTSHRQAVEKALKDDKTRAEQEARNSLSILTEAIADSNNMKQDILASLDLIKQAEEKSFRPVMQSYKQNARKFKQTTGKITIPTVHPRHMVLSDFSHLRHSILQSLHVEFKSQSPTPPTMTPSLGQKSPPGEVSNIEHGSMSSINFSFEAKMAAELNRDCCSGEMEFMDSGEYSKYIKSGEKQRAVFHDFNHIS